MEEDLALALALSRSEYENSVNVSKSNENNSHQCFVISDDPPLYSNLEQVQDHSAFVLNEQLNDNSENILTYDPSTMYEMDFDHLPKNFEVDKCVDSDFSLISAAQSLQHEEEVPIYLCAVLIISNH